MSSGNHKGAVTDGGQLSAADDQRWSRAKMQSLRSLDICHLTNFMDKEVWQCCPTKTFIHKDGTLQSNP